MMGGKVVRRSWWLVRVLQPCHSSEAAEVKGGSNYAVFAADKIDPAALLASFILKYSMREGYVHKFISAPAPSNEEKRRYVH